MKGPRAVGERHTSHKQGPWCGSGVKPRSPSGSATGPLHSLFSLALDFPWQPVHCHRHRTTSCIPAACWASCQMLGTCRASGGVGHRRHVLKWKWTLGREAPGEKPAGLGMECEKVTEGGCGLYWVLVLLESCSGGFPRPGSPNPAFMSATLSPPRPLLCPTRKPAMRTGCVQDDLTPHFRHLAAA